MTKSKFAFVVTIAVFLLASILPVVAQRGGGYRTKPRPYNPTTEVTVKGSVEEVTEQSGRAGWNGTHLKLKTDTETLDIHVGPSSFISQNQFSFAKGDQIEVTGSKVKPGKGNAVLAREIKKEGKTLTLRNAQGVPLWSGAAGR